MMSNQKCSFYPCHSGNYMSFRGPVSGTEDEDQIYISCYITISQKAYHLWVELIGDGFSPKSFCLSGFTGEIEIVFNVRAHNEDELKMKLMGLFPGRLA